MHSLRGWVMICGLSWFAAEAVPATSVRLASALAHDDRALDVEAHGRLGVGEVSLALSVSSAHGPALTFVCATRIDESREAADR